MTVPMKGFGPTQGNPFVIVEAVESTRLEKGGPAQSVPKLANAISALGYRVAVVCPDHFAQEANYADVYTEVFPTWKNLQTQLAGAQPSILHLHGIWNPFQHRLARFARQLRIPYVFSPRGMLEPWSMNHKRWKKRIAWWLYQKRDLQLAALLHATADMEMEQFRKLGLTNHVVVLPNGVDIPDLASTDSPKSEDPKVRTALFLGRVHPKKGLLMLAEAWARVRPMGWRMLVVGPDCDGHRSQVSARVRSMGIDSEWEFMDAQYAEAKADTFKNSELFILPTFSENFGIAVAEALSFGLPVLTTTGTPWNLLTSKECGWWIEPTVEGVALGLKNAVLSSPERLREMGRNGRSWMQSDFGWPTIGRKMLDAYRTIPGVALT